MKLQDLLESVDTTSANSDRVAGMKDEIDACAKLIFGGVHAGPVKDTKRSKEPIFYGVAHQKSLLTDPRGKSVYLTFDNSTDSGEFEINSLVPLMIERGSKEDVEIKSLFRKYDVSSKKKTNYIAYGDKIVLREIHVGKEIDINTVKMVRALVKVLTHQDASVDDEDESREDKKDSDGESASVKKSAEKDAKKKPDKPAQKKKDK